MGSCITDAGTGVKKYIKKTALPLKVCELWDITCSKTYDSDCPLT
jgi:hypothetical protein